MRKQIPLIKTASLSYGGELLKKRKGRLRGRPIDTTQTMHMVLRSAKATGDWAFWKKQNKEKISAIIEKFSSKYGVRVLSLANVGNHLHFHLKITNRYAYRRFIRAVTAAIAMAITGVSRWNKEVLKDKSFWDYRPFTRVIAGLRAALGIREYLEINQLEGIGYSRPEAKIILAQAQHNSS